MLAPRSTRLRSQRDINLWRIPLQLSLAAVALFGITLIPDILDKYRPVVDVLAKGEALALAGAQLAAPDQPNRVHLK